MPIETCPAEKAAENFVNLAKNMVNTRSFTLKEINKATLEDEDLFQLKNALLRGHFRANETASKSFAKVFNELCVTSHGLVLRGLRIVLPQALRSSAVKLAHEEHQGICKTKSLLRAKIWLRLNQIWLPLNHYGIDVMVE